MTDYTPEALATALENITVAGDPRSEEVHQAMLAMGEAARIMRSLDAERARAVAAERERILAEMDARGFGGNHYPEAEIRRIVCAQQGDEKR